MVGYSYSLVLVMLSGMTHTCGRYEDCGKVCFMMLTHDVSSGLILVSCTLRICTEMIKSSNVNVKLIFKICPPFLLCQWPEHQ